MASQKCTFNLTWNGQFWHMSPLLARIAQGEKIINQFCFGDILGGCLCNAKIALMKSHACIGHFRDATCRPKSTHSL